MNGFKEGYNFFLENAGTVLAAFNSDNYIDSINEQVDKLVQELNDFDGYETAVEQLKGDVFEFWHTGTFNINATIKGSNSFVNVDRSNDFGSVDISSNFGKDFGLKAYASGSASAKAQSVSFYERYNQYKMNGGTDSLSEFLRDKGINDESLVNDSIYSGQIRVIPKDQLIEAKDWLIRKINTEKMIRPEQVKRYQDTYDFITDKLQDDNGVESIPMTKEQAEELARLAKQGDVDAEKMNLSTKTMIEFEDILRNSINAGLTAATITMILKIAPEIYKAFELLVYKKTIDAEQFKKVGFAAVSGAAEGFIRGTIAAAITVYCKSGKLGGSLVEINPSVIGATVVVSMNVLKNSFYLTCGKIDSKEVVNNLIKDIYISSFTLVSGGLSSVIIPVPILGYMLGTFIGSMIGSFTYNAGQKTVLSFCVNNGFTMFGLVDQDYKLPDEVLNRIGLEIFKYETFEPETLEVESVNLEFFNFDRFVPETIGYTFLRRGVIGINRVGYLR